MIYDIKLKISYDYGGPAAAGRHMLCLMPLELRGVQRLMAGLIDIVPRPGERTDQRDFFENRTTEFALTGQHDSLAIQMTARVERFGAAPGLLPSPSLAGLGAEIAACRSMGPASPVHFVAASPRVPHDAAMHRFATAVLQPGAPAAAIATALSHALYKVMIFDPEATEVDTPAAEAFAKRHGVCQDFSHILIGCLRSIGIPAGYVSGFLRTRPPPGKPRLEGADAMHAWVRAWCGQAVGWVELDPTNDCLAGANHIVVAYGRDYSDVPPVRGILRVSGDQKTDQAVDVIPVGE